MVLWKNTATVGVCSDRGGRGGGKAAGSTAKHLSSHMPESVEQHSFRGV